MEKETMKIFKDSRFQNEKKEEKKEGGNERSTTTHHTTTRYSYFIVEKDTKRVSWF